MLRKGMMLVALGSAVGVPYVTSEWSKIKANFGGGNSTTSANQFSKTPSAHSFGASPATGNPSTPAQPQHPLAADPQQLEETPLVDMKDALRFNISPDWIISRWPRVTAGIPLENQHGMRVTLITGLLYDDLAGALTYYFTPAQKCSKITFSGTTGDPRRLTALARERFGFNRYHSEAGIERYEIRWNGDAHSELLIRPARVVRSSAPNARYEVQLLIVDPAT